MNGADVNRRPICALGDELLLASWRTRKTGQKQRRRGWAMIRVKQCNRGVEAAAQRELGCDPKRGSRLTLDSGTMSVWMLAIEFVMTPSSIISNLQIGRFAARPGRAERVSWTVPPALRCRTSGNGSVLRLMKSASAASLAFVSSEYAPPAASSEDGLAFHRQGNC